MRARDTRGWFKVDLCVNATADLTKCYYWIAGHCKGKFQISQDYIMFENDKDATFFGIGYK